MNIEDYVNFEIAELLKQKDFNWGCISYYKHFSSNVTLYSGMVSEWSNSYIDHNKIDGRYSRPTLQMAMKWLLKKYNIFICPLFLEESNGFGYTIENIIKKEYITTSKNSSYKEPEEACETAIKYCLKHLI